MKRIIYLVLITCCFSSSIFAQDWIVPDDQKEKRSDFAFDDTVVTAGETLYMTNCKSCHGDPGQGNVIALNPAPSDPASEKVQGNNDGELYYKMREGKGLMPSFKNILSVRQTWEVIAFVRSFNEAYVQEVAVKRVGANNRWQDISIELSYLAQEQQIMAIVTGKEGDTITPVNDVDVKLLAKRMFGTLMIDDVKTTNESGEVRFAPPDDLPGDPEGLVEVICQLDDEEAFGVIAKETALAFGVPVTPVSLSDTRAMWSTVKKAPYWIIFAYGLSVLAAWGLIFYVLLQLRSIFKLGEQEQ